MSRNLPRSTTRWLATATTTALILGSAAALPASAAAAGKDHNDRGSAQSVGPVTGKAVNRHLKKFQWIADRNGGNRATGQPGYDASAEYVEKKLRKAGYEPQRQYFDVESFNVNRLVFTVPGVEVAPIALSYSNSTPEGGVEAPLTTPTSPLGCDAAAYAGANVTGSIVLVSRGTCTFAAKASAAGAAGAAGVVIHNNVEGPLNGTLGGRVEGSAPGVGVTQAEGAALRTAIESGSPTATFDLQTSVDTVKTFNVIAETRGGSADNVVMVGAHLDSTQEGPGINDNASGSAAVLETALQLAKADQARHPGKKGAKKSKGKRHGAARGGSKQPKHGINNKVRFAWWGAEELGLHGSNHYVADLQANAPEQLEKIAVYLNFDMIGSPNHIIGVYDADESTYPAPVEVPEGSAAAEAAFTKYFDQRNQPWVDTEFSGRSDYQAFINAGVPSTGLFTGADGVKTEEEQRLFGGTAGVTYDPNYHQAGDDITNINREALDVTSRAIGTVVAQFAKSTVEINGVGATTPKDPKGNKGHKGHKGHHGTKGHHGPKRFDDHWGDRKRGTQSRHGEGHDRRITHAPPRRGIDSHGPTRKNRDGRDRRGAGRR